MSEPKRRKWEQAYDGDWLTPRKKNYAMACCDCGLVHVVNFRINDRGQIQYQPARDRRATAARRRNRALPMKLKPKSKQEK